MAATSYGTGRLTAGVADVVYLPSGSLAGSNGVVFCHGLTQTEQVGLDLVTTPKQAALIRWVADNFGPVVAGPFAGDSWGNAAAVAAIGQAVDWLVANTTADLPVSLLGVSMGCAAALAYAAANRAKVRAVVGIIGASGLQAMRAAGILTASIDAAWGVTYPAALPAGADPVSNAALVGLKFRNFYSTADSTIPPATVTALVAAIGSTASATVIDTVLGHTEATVGLASFADVAAGLA